MDNSFNGGLPCQGFIQDFSLGRGGEEEVGTLTHVQYVDTSNLYTSPCVKEMPWRGMKLMYLER